MIFKQLHAVLMVVLFVLPIQKAFCVSSIGRFSIDSNRYVSFSPGYLQFNAALGSHKCADGKTKKGTWRFAEHQWDIVSDSNELRNIFEDKYTQRYYYAKGTVYYKGVECDNDKIAEDYEGWIDKFCWATSGWDNTANDSFAINFEPWLDHDDITLRVGQRFPSPFFNELRFKYNDNCLGPSLFMPDIDLIGTSRYYDWGQYNQIEYDEPGNWRTLTLAEWQYLLNRKDKNGNNLYGFGSIITDENDTVYGLILLPDDWKMSKGMHFSSDYSSGRNTNSYTLSEWVQMEKNDALFFPLHINKKITEIYDLDDDDERSYNSKCAVWSSSASFKFPAASAWQIFFFYNNSIDYNDLSKNTRRRVRLVHDLPTIPCDTLLLRDTICPGDTLFWLGKPRTQAGAYRLLHHADTACRLDLLHLAFRPFDSLVHFDTICEGGFLVHNGKKRSAAGIYYDTLRNNDDCLLDILHLAVLPLHQRSDTTLALCQGETLRWNGQPCAQSGLYSHSWASDAGCDLEMLHLSVLPVYHDTLVVHLCDGGYSGRKSYTLNGKEYRANGLYIDTLKTVAGCDSVVVLDLQVQPAYFDTILELVPYGGSWVWHDSTFDRGGFFIDWEHSVYGCDSVTTHRVRFQSPYETTAILEAPDQETVVRVRKVLENGHILIFIDDRKYNIFGQAVK